MLATNLIPQLHAYLADPVIAASIGLDTQEVELSFLAQGEYNINYLLTTPYGRRVVRVNVGTQIGKAGGEQIAYEAAALCLIEDAHVGPHLYHVDPSLERIPYGLLIMEYLPGVPLDYGNSVQIAAAAATLARLHTIAAPANSPFIHRRPLIDDLAEAQSWLAPYLACERAPLAVREIFEHLLEQAQIAAERDTARFPEPFALVHTDVQAHNFIVDTQANALRVSLVDWERPLIDDPTYDLVHFLLPTTTRWKCGYTFTQAEQQHFLEAYCAARPDLDAADVRERQRIRRPFILMRALGWCAGAWVDYTGPGRAINNNDTLLKIEEYLQPQELKELFGEWL